MSNSLEAILAKYLTAKKLSGRTRKEYRSMAAKWDAWGKVNDVDDFDRTHVRDFLDWVHDQAAEAGGSNTTRRLRRPPMTMPEEQFEPPSFR